MIDQFPPDLEAVKQAIADMEAGDRGIPFDEFIEEFRKEHNIAEDAGAGKGVRNE